MAYWMEGPPVSLAQAESVCPKRVPNPPDDSGLCGPRGGPQSLATLRYMNADSGEVKLSEVAGLVNCMRSDAVSSQDYGSPLYERQTATDMRKEGDVLNLGQGIFPPPWNNSANGWDVTTVREKSYNTWFGAQYVNIWNWAPAQFARYTATVTAKTTKSRGVTHRKTFSLISFTQGPYTGLADIKSTGGSPADLVDATVDLFYGAADTGRSSILASLEIYESVDDSTDNKETVTQVTGMDIRGRDY